MDQFSVVADKLTKKYSGKTIFSNVSFRLDKGSSLVIIGRNGSGKSTLLKIISGLIGETSGKIKFMQNENEQERSQLNSKIGFVSPYLNLYDELTGIENLELFSRLKSDADAVNNDEIRQLISEVGLYERRNDQVKAYSSGMKQKLKLAFALLNDPYLLMMDEPRSNLDRDGIEKIESVAVRQRERGILIIATNDEDDLKLCSEKLNIEDFKP